MVKFLDFKVIYLDIEKCTGCGNCLVACETNEKINPSTSFGVGSSLRNVLRVVNGKINASHICEQCTDAPCIESCPDKLLVLEDNIVTFKIDAKKDIDKQLLKIYRTCTACKEKNCIAACKSENMVLVEAVINNEKMSYPTKCDQCEGTPLCVAACPTGALTYVDVNSQKFKEKLKFAELLAKSATT